MVGKKSSLSCDKEVPFWASPGCREWFLTLVRTSRPTGCQEVAWSHFTSNSRFEPPCAPGNNFAKICVPASVLLNSGENTICKQICNQDTNENKIPDSIQDNLIDHNTPGWNLTWGLAESFLEKGRRVLRNVLHRVSNVSISTKNLWLTCFFPTCINQRFQTERSKKISTHFQSGGLCDVGTRPIHQKIILFSQWFASPELTL